MTMTKEEIMKKAMAALNSKAPLNRQKVLAGLYELRNKNDPAYIEDGDKYWKRVGVQTACDSMIAVISTGSCDQ